MSIGGLPKPGLINVTSPRIFANDSIVTTDNDSDNTPKRNDTSLGATSKRFVALMTSAADQTVELNDAARKLQAPKRRIYDVTNVLEGIGLVTKKTKNHFQWVGGEVDPDNHVEPDEVELTRLREREAELTQAIEQQETQLKYLTEHNDRLGYVTCKDLRSIFRQHLVLCLKAPQDTKLQVPDPSEGFQMLLKSTRGSINCYLCPEIEDNETESEKEPHVEENQTSRDNENNDSNDSGENKFLPFSPLSDREYIFTLEQNEGIANLFDMNM